MQKAKKGNKNALTHAATSRAARSGEVPAGFEHLIPVVESYWGNWVSDLGGESEVTSQERAILHSSKICLVVALLSADYVAQHGLTDAKGNPQPILKILGTFLNTLRLNLCAVGLKRRARKADGLEGYLEERYGDKGTSQQAAQKPPRKASRK